MSFLKSLLLGSSGSYNICGTIVNFEEQENRCLDVNKALSGAGLISTLAIKCINSTAFRLISQGYLHIFVHEMGHAISCKLLTKKDSTIKIFTNSCTGVNITPESFKNLSDWEQSVSDAAGPLANIAFSSLKLVAAAALKDYLTVPLSLVLGSGGVIWISGELLYAYICSSKENEGDFGRIAQRSGFHLSIASVAIVAQCALGLFTAIKSAH